MACEELHTCRKHLRGVGLRPHHYEEWINNPPHSIHSLEVITENYLGHKGGPALYYLERITEPYDLLLHGVNLNIGGAEECEPRYLKELKKLIKRLNPMIVSDHLSFSALEGRHSHSLLPLPRTEETVKFLSTKIAHVQNELGRSLALENISRYVTYEQDELSEIEFTNAVLNESGCQLLLDVNNLYVTCINEGLNPEKELLSLEKNRVVQYHIAGHQNCEHYLYDTHSGSIHPEVWNLLSLAIRRHGEHPIILEQDDHEALATVIQKWNEDPTHVKDTEEFASDSKNFPSSHPASTVSSTESFFDSFS